MTERTVSLPGLVRLRAERDADRVALTSADNSRRFTWGDMHDRSLIWSGMLANLGVEQGDIVATMLVAGDEAFVSWVGIAALGALEAPLNHAYKGEWLKRVLETIRPKAVIIDQRFCEHWEPLLDDLTLPIVTVGPEARPGFLLAADLAEGARTPTEIVDGGAADPACVILTSGTTGRSKGVIVPWGRCDGTMFLAELLDPDADGTYYNPFPTFHWSARGPLYRAASRRTAVVTRERFKTDTWLEDLRRFGCTDTFLIGAMLGFLMGSPSGEDDANNPLRACIAAPVPPFIDEFAQRFGIGTVMTTYAMSEIVNVFATPKGRSVTAEKYQSCGMPVGVPIRLVREDGSLALPGQTGELQVGGDRAALNLGYVNDPVATASAWTADGWFKTGDVFRQDEEGYYYFVDRLKDALRRRGENISSTEVEAAALRHPAIVECAVVGVPSEWSEDEVMIFVVVSDGAHLGASELVEFMTAHVPSFAVPRYVEFVTELPKTPTLKVQKSLLRDRGPSENTWDRSRLEHSGQHRS